MNVEQIKSGALKRAALKSESYRMLLLLSVLGALMLYTIVRGLATGQARLLLSQLLLLLLAIACEALMLGVVKRALRRGRDIRSAMYTPPKRSRRLRLRESLSASWRALSITMRQKNVSRRETFWR